MHTLQFSPPPFITLMDFSLFLKKKNGKIKERHIRKITCRNCTALINPRGSKFLYVSCRRSTRQMNFSFPISCSLIALKQHKQIFFMKNQKMGSTFYLSDHQKLHCTMNGNIFYIYICSENAITFIVVKIKIEENQVSGGATHEQVKLNIRGKRKQPKDTNEWVYQMDPSIA